MARLIPTALLLLLLLPGLALAGGIEVREFDGPVMERRYAELTATLRCPKCQNQAIDDSDSPIAGDMRDRVYALLQDGRSDKELVQLVQNLASKVV
ncbi:MAG TPA: cytochrome c-type biogenesis protein [Guyparkeria sp.]|nr:cytochrome c-type biogenesis protein [Guyparkeria sp.]